MIDRNSWIRKGTPISFGVYSGVVNSQSGKIYSQLESMMAEDIPLEISGSDGKKMRIDSVNMKIKERDLEYNLELCEIIVNGEIL